MASKAFNLADLETVFRTVVAGSRSDRLRAVNAFRTANGRDAVEYLVNAHTLTRGKYDDALALFEGDVSNAAGTSVTGGTVDLEEIFTYLLVSGRSDRLHVLNVCRTQLGDDPVEYLVNLDVPNSGERDAAFESVEADAAA